MNAAGWSTIAAFMSVLLQACSTCEPGPSLYTRGSVAVRVNSNGQLVNSPKHGRIVALRHPGESFDVKAGEPFTLNIPDAVDLATYALVIRDKDSSVKGSPVFSLSLKESCTPYVEMDKRCKIINWYNPYRLPEVRVRRSDDQVIMTPLLGDNDKIIGYEIRLGDHRVCGSPALDRLRAVREGRDKVKTGASTQFAPLAEASVKQPMDIGVLVIVVGNGTR